MHFLAKTIFALLAITATGNSLAQTAEAEDAELLKLAALEALISAPPERALPLVKKVLATDASDAVKSRAMFVLSQIDLPEAQMILLETARDGSGDLQHEAIRMIGIGGNDEAMAGLGDIYKSGDSDAKQSVLAAYLIAGDDQAVLEIANQAESDEEFDRAVNTLAAMGATDQLHLLRGREAGSESLIHAYAVAGDFDRLKEIATDSSNPQQQMHAIHGLGVVGGDEVGITLLEIYRSSDDKEVRQQAMHGMFIADYDAGIVELFRESSSTEEKGELLRILVMMDSDFALDVIDETLGSNE